MDFREVYAPPVRILELVAELVEETTKTEQIAPGKRYVMGLSMGSFGTFELLARWPAMFAAAVAICGGGNVSVVDRYAAHAAVWITHGSLDDIVSAEFSRRMFHALKNAGADVRYTEFEGVNHNEWIQYLHLRNH